MHIIELKKKDRDKIKKLQREVEVLKEELRAKEEDLRLARWKVVTDYDPEDEHDFSSTEVSDDLQYMIIYAADEERGIMR